MDSTEIQSHPRYVEFSIAPGCEITKLSFIIFHRDGRLRYHTIKHFMKESEWNAAWESYAKTSFSNIAKVYKKIESLGCQYTTGEPAKPNCGGCKVFSRCSSIGIEAIQDTYKDIIEEILSGVLKEPRFVRYMSAKNRWWTFVAFNGKWVKIVGSLSNDAYNITTVFVLDPVYPGQTWEDMRSRMVGLIRDDSHLRTRKWCTKRTWGIEDSMDWKDKLEQIL